MWKKIAGFGDKIIHYYFGVNWDIVWDVLRNHIPELKKKIACILEIETYLFEDSFLMLIKSFFVRIFLDKDLYVVVY